MTGTVPMKPKYAALIWSREEIANPTASPSAKRPKFRKAEGARPYDPRKSVAAGQIKYGHQLLTAEFLKKELLSDVADDAASSSMSIMLFVRFLASLSRWA